jgi:PAS domain S-box-containing protein
MTRRSLFPGVLWVVPVLSLGVTAFAWRTASTTIAARAEERFAFRTDVIESTIRERMRNYEDILRGAAGLFDSSSTVTRAEWQRYMGAIRPGVFGGGVQALGVAVRLQPADIESFETLAHGERLPVRIWPSGNRDEYFPIVYVHPFDGANAQGLGYDISAEAARRRAMMRAADEGRPMLSSRMRLAQESDQASEQPGFVLYYPLYHNGLPTTTVEERRQALRGVVFVAFRARDLMDSVFAAHHWDVDFDLYDGEIDRDDALLYRYGEHRLTGITSSPGTLVYRTVMRQAGQPWFLIISPSASFFSSADRYQPWLIAEGGVAVSLMFALGLWSSLTVRRRAIVLAEQMSSAYRAKDAQTRVMVDSITDHAIFTLDVRRHVASWNAGCERMLGFSEPEILGRPVTDLLPEIDRDDDSGRIDTAHEGQYFREGWHSRRNGDRFWCAVAIAPLKSETTSERGYVVVLRDDTERRQAMDALAHTSEELEQRTVELGRFNRLAFGRELRMLELKRMVNERSVALGLAAPFDLSFAEGFEDVRGSEDASA